MAFKYGFGLSQTMRAYHLRAGVSPNPRFSLTILGALALAGIFLVSLLVLGSGHGPAIPSSPPHSAASALNAAEASLARGSGPAGGVPMHCSAVVGDTSCSSGDTTDSVTGASAGWANISGHQTSSPIPRSYGRSMAYDPTDHYVVLFGGYTESGYISDTWTFENGTWTELSPAAAPSDRDHSTLVWDPTDGYLLLFGGSGSGGQYSDTWSFLNGSWTQHFPGTHPSGRWSASMTWDAADNYVLLFGGCSSNTEQSDTWTYLGGTWTELAPASHPSSRGDAGMTYDPSTSAVVLFGGYNGDSSWAYFNDTWTFHAGNWTEVNTTVAPSERTSPAFAYDPWLNGVVLFGGQGPLNFLADTWLFANGAWTPLPTSSAPTAREFGIMATDPADGYLLLFGGEGNSFYNDTWVFYTMNATAHSGSVTAGDAPLPTTFSATASDPFPIATYAWSFGDGTYANGPSVNHTFDRAGEFQVALTATDSNGVFGTATTSVTVNPALSLIALASVSHGPAPLPVNWVAVQTGGAAPYQWAWTIGGAFVSSAENFSYTFTAVGNYSVAVTVTDSFHSHATQEFAINVNATVPQELVATASASALVGEAPLNVTFTGSATGGVLPYSSSTWDFGDGSMGTGVAVTHEFTFAGNFTVTYRVTDADHTTATATTLTLTVLPSLGVSATASTTGGAAPVSVTFSATTSGGVGPYLFLWAFGDGASATGASAAHSYTHAGTFAASVEAVDSAGHTSTSTVSVVVTAGTTTTTPSGGSGGTGLSFDTTAVLVGAELVLGGIAVLGLVAYARRRR